MKPEELSIDFDDDDKDYLAFSEHITEHTERIKNVISNDIELLGEDLLLEIEEKNKINDIEKEKLINYILKHSKKYKKYILLKYSIADIRDIYNEIKNTKNFLQKLFQFIFFSK